MEPGLSTIPGAGHPQQVRAGPSTTQVHSQLNVRLSLTLEGTSLPFSDCLIGSSVKGHLNRCFCIIDGVEVLRIQGSERANFWDLYWPLKRLHDVGQSLHLAAP